MKIIPFDPYPHRFATAQDGLDFIESGAVRSELIVRPYLKNGKPNPKHGKARYELGFVTPK